MSAFDDLSIRQCLLSTMSAFDDVSIKTTSLMVSGYGAMPITRNKREAHLGGGIGVCYTTIDAFSLTPFPGVMIQVPSDHDTNFGYQAKLGLTYKVK